VPRGPLSERRYDPTADEWVTFATHRQDRTYQPPVERCPFCPTVDPARPTEIPRPTFEIAVFDNRFPGLQPEPPAPDVAATPLIAIEPAAGRCEVVVYSDRHDATLAEIGVERLRLLVDVWADRYETLGAEPEVRYVLVFENRGEVIGVTLAHPHGQIYGYGDVPPRPLRELRAADGYRRRTGRCVECDVVTGEIADGRRVVARRGGVVAFVPPWARFPYEVHVVPVLHRPGLPDLPEAERDDVAELLEVLLRAYDALFGFPLPYVMGIHQAPTCPPADLTGRLHLTGGLDALSSWDPVSHVHWEFAPVHRTAEKIKYLAGSEMMGGAYLTDVAPEVAAESLRRALG
jgi:UDPglucose--hexose-1-phosphate uridylyltransferase